MFLDILEIQYCKYHKLLHELFSKKFYPNLKYLLTVLITHAETIFHCIARLLPQLLRPHVLTLVRMQAVYNPVSVAGINPYFIIVDSPVAP